MNKEQKINLLETGLETLIEEMHKAKENPFWNNGVLLRQFHLEGYGRMDLVHIETTTEYDFGIRSVDTININVLELKKEKIGYNEIGQLARYMKGVKRYLFLKGIEESDRLKINVYGISIGKEIDNTSDFVYLMELMKDIQVYSYRLNYKTGLEFYEINFDYFNKKEKPDNITNKQLKDIFKLSYVEFLEDEILEKNSYQDFLKSNEYK